MTKAFVGSVSLTPHRRKAALYRQHQANPGHEKGGEYSPIPQERVPITVQCTAADSLAERRAEWNTSSHRAPGQGVFTLLLKSQGSFVIGCHTSNLWQRQQTLSAVGGAHFQFCAEAIYILPGSGGLNLKDQACTVADHRLTRIREKLDAMALGNSLILPLVYLQRPLHQIALNAKPAMMGQDWSPAEQQTNGTEESAASNAPMRIVSRLWLVSTLHSLQPGIA